MSLIKKVKNYRDTSYIFNLQGVTTLGEAIVWIYEKIIDSCIFKDVNVQVISWLYGSKVPNIDVSKSVDYNLEMFRPFANHTSELMIKCKCNCAPVKIHLSIEEGTITINVRKMNTADIEIIMEGLSLHRRTD